MSQQSAEFHKPRLAQIYEDFNQFSEDEDFWLKTIEGLDISHITDFGCGTWMFTLTLLAKWYTMLWIEPAAAMLEIAKQNDIEKNVEWREWSSEKLNGFTTDLVLLTSHVAQFITDEDDWNMFLKNTIQVLNPWGYILFDSKNPLSKPWENYTRDRYNRTQKTMFGDVNMTIEVWNISWDVITHTIYYDFLETWETYTSSNTLVYKTKEELEQSLIRHGFVVVKIYWGWDWEAYSETSWEMIFLAQKI